MSLVLWTFAARLLCQCLSYFVSPEDWAALDLRSFTQNCLAGFRNGRGFNLAGPSSYWNRGWWYLVMAGASLLAAMSAFLPQGPCVPRLFLWERLLIATHGMKCHDARLVVLVVPS